VAAEEDTPRAAFGLVSWRVSLTIVIALVTLSALAWLGTIEQSHAMGAMVMGLGQIGRLNQGNMGAGLFLAMWLSMMAAMMLPTIAPMVVAHAAIVRRRGEGVLPTLVFIAGYLLVWATIGVVPLLASWGIAQLGDAAAQSHWLPALAGMMLIVAGAYQFTGWKRVCLDHCQSPFAFVVSHDFGGGARSAVRAGVVHGAYCLGCCWAMMAVLLVVGLMNLVWMAGLFVLFFTEKHWKRGLVLAKIAGIALVILGAAVIAWPALLALISQ